jgi:hypothetical protein
MQHQSCPALYLHTTTHKQSRRPSPFILPSTPSAPSQASGRYFVLLDLLVPSQPPSSSSRQSSSHVPCCSEIFAAGERRVLAAKKALAVMYSDKGSRGTVDECNASEWFVNASTHDVCPPFPSPPARHPPPLYDNHRNPWHHSTKSLGLSERLGMADAWYIGRWLWEKQHHHRPEKLASPHHHSSFPPPLHNLRPGGHARNHGSLRHKATQLVSTSQLSFHSLHTGLRNTEWRQEVVCWRS